MRAQIVVGADGSASAVARSLRGPRHPRCDSLIAVRAYYEGVAGADDCCDLYFSGDSFPGYYWLFPAGKGRANVGIGMVTETIPPCQRASPRPARRPAGRGSGAPPSSDGQSAIGKDRRLAALDL